MRDKKDQLQAHLFLVGRLSSAVVLGDPDAPEPPLRRSTKGAAGGLALTLLALTALLVWGFISPGANTSWRTEGAVVIDKDNGIRYVYLDGVLHPTANQTSARLIAGSAEDAVSVSAASLSDEVVGVPVGIVGAPDPVPALDGGATTDGATSTWAICATRSTAGDSAAPTVTVVLDRPDLTTPVGDGAGVLVATPDTDDLHLVTSDGIRHRVVGEVVAAALGVDRLTPFEVTGSWLNASEPASDISTIGVDGLGDPGPSVAGLATIVGQVYVVERINGVSANYVMLADGLAPITQTQALVHLGNPDTAAAYGEADVAPIALQPADVTTVGESASTLDGSDWPETLPLLLDPSVTARPCTQLEIGESISRTLVSAADFDGATDVPAAGEANGIAADRVLADPGTGGLVQTTVGGEAQGAVFLYNDIGVKYPVPSEDALDSLGLAGIPPIALPPEIIDFLPTGPALDAERARRSIEIQPGNS